MDVPESSLAVTSAVEVLCSGVTEASGGEVSGFEDWVEVTGGEAAQIKRSPSKTYKRENKMYLVLLLVALAVFFASPTTHLALPQYLGKTARLKKGNAKK